MKKANRRKVEQAKKVYRIHWEANHYFSQMMERTFGEWECIVALCEIMKEARPKKYPEIKWRIISFVFPINPVAFHCTSANVVQLGAGEMMINHANQKKQMKGKNFSTNNTGKRKKSDFYETPYSLTRLLLEEEDLYGSILEPACGNGAIVKVLREYDYLCDYHDIEKDFLMQTQIYDNIITNPPYSLAQEFILKAKQNACEKIIFLLPLSYLHGKKRYDQIWTDKDFPLARIYVFTRYPLLGEDLREDGKHNTGMMVYAWYVWEKGYKGEPVIKWLDNNAYILKK